MFSEIDAYKPSRPSCETLRISKEYPVLFRLMLTTGLRRSEAVSIRIQDPYLSRHLGHKSADETFYYYHQVLDSLKLIRQKDTLSSIVLPEVRVR